MALVPEWIRAAVRYLSHWILAGRAERATYERVVARVGQISQEDYWLAVQETQAGIEAVQRLWQISPMEPIRAALAGEEPPSDIVDVRVVFTLARAPEHYHSELVHIETGWDVPLAQVYQQAREAAQEWASRYETTPVEITIIPPLRYPRD